MVDNVYDLLARRAVSKLILRLHEPGCLQADMKHTDPVVGASLIVRSLSHTASFGRDTAEVQRLLRERLRTECEVHEMRMHLIAALLRAVEIVLGCAPEVLDLESPPPLIEGMFELGQGDGAEASLACILSEPSIAAQLLASPRYEMAALQVFDLEYAVASARQGERMQQAYRRVLRSLCDIAVSGEAYAHDARTVLATSEDRSVPLMMVEAVAAADADGRSGAATLRLADEFVVHFGMFDSPTLITAIGPLTRHGDLRIEIAAHEALVHWSNQDDHQRAGLNRAVELLQIPESELAGEVRRRCPPPAGTTTPFEALFLPATIDVIRQAAWWVLIRCKIDDPAIPRIALEAIRSAPAEDFKSALELSVERGLPHDAVLEALEGRHPPTGSGAAEDDEGVFVAGLDYYRERLEISADSATAQRLQALRVKHAAD